MTDAKEGDLVEVWRDETMLRGRVVELGAGADRVRLEGVHHYLVESDGWKVTVIENAKPKFTLPDETGTVALIKGDGDRWWLAWKSHQGDWDVITPRGEVERVSNPPIDGIVGVIESVDILEPRAVSAKAVIDRLSELDTARTGLRCSWTNEHIETLSAEFGVTS